jgi:hypothetical protein
MNKKRNSDFRYCFVNISGLPISMTHEKQDLITQTIENYEIDVLGLAEINLNLSRLDPHQQWQHRFSRLKTNSHCSTNTHSTSTDRVLFGGTAYLTNETTSHKVSQKGSDTTGLGRWTWLKLTGRQGITVRIINGYRPVADTSNRAGTVYSQQQKYFQDDGNAREPRLAFLEDLGAAILT